METSDPRPTASGSPAGGREFARPSPERGTPRTGAAPHAAGRETPHAAGRETPGAAAREPRRSPTAERDTSHAAHLSRRAVPVTRRRRATRERILTAAMEVFAEKGLNGASVDDIAAAAGFTKGAVYSNFRTKEEVFSAVFARRSEELLDAAQVALDTTRVEVGVDSIVEILARIQPVDRTWYLMHTEYELYALRNPEAAREYTVLREASVDKLTQYVAHALGRMGRASTIGDRRLAETIMAVYLSFVTAAHLSDDGVEAGADQLSDLLPQLVSALSVPV